VHDGIHIEKAGIPAAVICTDRFLTTATAMAKMWGAPDFPVLYAEHPMGSLDRTAIKQKAVELVDEVVACIIGAKATDLRPRD
jgi:hypothetical protein